MDNLFDYQVDEVRTLQQVAARHPCIIEGGDPGTGKTYVLSAVCADADAPAFVICPKPVVGSWFKVLTEAGVNILGVANYELIRNGKFYATAAQFTSGQGVPCPYIEVAKEDGAMAEFAWRFPDGTYIIIDEAHRGKNNITIASHMMLSMKPVIPQGGNNRLFILSGTITDKVECFRVAAHLLDITQYGKHAYSRWLRGLADKYPGLSQLEAIHHEVYPEHGSRMRKTDERVRAMFRANNIRTECVPVSPDVERMITEAYQDIADAIMRLRTKEQGEMCALTAMLRARQRIEMLKIEPIIQLATEHLLRESAVIIFVNFDNTIDTLFTALDSVVQQEFQSFITFVRGGQSSAEREAEIAKFQSGESCLMIANIEAGGIGISLHHIDPRAKPRVAVFSPPWSSITLKQGTDRIHRAGALSDAVQIIVYCKGWVAPAGERNKNDTSFTGDDGAKVGIEELIAQAVNKKLRTIEWINNGDEDDLTQI